MYPFTFYTNRFIPAEHAACARGFVIFIRPEYKDDKGLLAHEMEHVYQWCATIGLHSFFYLLSKQYRLWAEVEAYKEQLKYSPGNELRFAEFIADKYGLNVSAEEALELLK